MNPRSPGGKSIAVARSWGGADLFPRHVAHLALPSRVYKRLSALNNAWATRKKSWAVGQHLHSYNRKDNPGLKLRPGTHFDSGGILHTESDCRLLGKAQA